MIVIIDYDIGNTGSILNIIRRVGGDAIVSRDEQDISTAAALILPGVGSFDNGVEKLRASGMLPLIEKCVFEYKIPFLGVCLGMQLIFDSSEEGTSPGLGWISGRVKRFDFSKTDKINLKIPHMGWCIVTPKQDLPLFNGLGADARFYFVHSYHVVCSDKHDAMAYAKYGYRFACVVQKENIYGVQFHPEKSHKFGMTLFKNFVEQIC